MGQAVGIAIKIYIPHKVCIQTDPQISQMLYVYVIQLVSKNDQKILILYVGCLA